MKNLTASLPQDIFISKVKKLQNLRNGFFSIFAETLPNKLLLLPEKNSHLFMYSQKRSQ